MSQTPDAQPAPQIHRTPDQDQGQDQDQGLHHRSSGLDAVDSVAAMLEQLDDLPVAEHVAVFERAHESLRGALSEAASTGPAARA